MGASSPECIVRRVMSRALALGLLWLGLALPGLTKAQPDDDCSSTNLLAGKRPSALASTRGEVDFVTDGRRPEEGTTWNGAGTLLLTEATATLTYDLGQARRVSAILAQADANDVYTVSASLDGEHFEPLVVLPNVVQSGHGLRTRSRVFPEQTVRYLRFGPSTGDGFYSLSELSLYCRAPATVSAADRACSHQRQGSRACTPGRAAVLAVRRAALVRAWAWSSRAVGCAWPRGCPSASSKAHARNTERLLHLMFVCSGAAALIYEIVWFHLLRLVIGASALSVGLVLASFMGGMFLGSLSFARLISSKRAAAARVWPARDRRSAPSAWSCPGSCPGCARSTSAWSATAQARSRCAPRSPDVCCCLPPR